MMTSDFEKTKKQSESEKRKKVPWELLLMIVAILMGVLHFVD